MTLRSQIILMDTLPAEHKVQVEGLPHNTRTLVDTPLRFASRGECSAHASDAATHKWPTQQLIAAQTFKLLYTRSNGKRPRVGDSDDSHIAKKSHPSPASPDEEAAEEDEGRPFYMLQREKLDIQIHQRSLRLVNPGTQAIEASVPFTALKRAFLLPPRSKTKPHWTVLLMSSDTPTPSGKANVGDSAKDNIQIVFGVDATPPTYSTTDHTILPTPSAYAKGTPILPFLRSFLSHLPVPLLEPDPAVFRAAASDSAGVQAYRAAKEGTLWFFDEGILWDSRPTEFWSCTELVSSANAAGKDGDGVQLVSATGRTCSVFVRWQVGGSSAASGGEGQKENQGEGGGESEEDEDEIQCIETGFSMVDGREQDSITQWVKRHRHLFGRPEEPTYAPSPSTVQADVESGEAKGKTDAKGKGRAVALPAEEDEDDEDDEEFVAEFALSPRTPHRDSNPILQSQSHLSRMYEISEEMSYHGALAILSWKATLKRCSDICSSRT